MSAFVTDEEWSELSAKWQAERDARAAKTAHRRVPMPTVPRGVCRWCERTIIGRSKPYIDRPDPRRSWCRPATEGRNCWLEFCLHSVAQSQAWFLRKRDGDRCKECGFAPAARWTKDGPQSCALDWSHGDNDVDFLRELWKREDAPDFPKLGLYQAITLRQTLEVDHVVPLWKVPTIGTLAERRAWFGPGNLQLLCTFHHKAKTKREAGERAAMRRSLRHCE